MTLGIGAGTAIGLLAIGGAQAIYSLKISPWFLERDRSRNVSFDDRIDSKKKRDAIASWIFLLVTVALSLGNIGVTAMSDEISKADFEALKKRVEALENDRPPGSSQALEKRLDALEKAANELREIAKNLASKEELHKTRKDLEKSIEKVALHVEELAKEVRQTRQKPLAN